MIVNFVKFYEDERDDKREFLRGTLHVHLDLQGVGINIKGIVLFKKKNYWQFRLPSRKSYDQDKGSEIYYSIIMFDSKEMTNELINILRVDGKKFIKAYLSSTPEATKQQAVSLASEPLNSISQGTKKGG